MNKVLKSMAIGFSLITGSQTMEAPMGVEGGKLIPQEQEAKKMTPKEENAYKMWLMKQHFEKSYKEGVLPEVHRDLQTVFGQTLHELANPVLKGELLYQGAPNPFKLGRLIKQDGCPFKIRGLIKQDGCMDLSDKEIFGDIFKYLVITTDPEIFLRFDKDSDRIIILIAPKHLIEEKIETTTKAFQPIMPNWKEEQAPIGIFYRMEFWGKLGMFDHITSANLEAISGYNLDLLWNGRATRRATCFDWEGLFPMTALRKVSFIF